MDDTIILAQDITGCDDCPLYKNDCSGGWTSGAGGTPIEPPCCSWNGDEEIYEGMYDTQIDYDYYNEERYKRKEEETKAAKRRQRIEELERQINEHTKYGNAKIRPDSICSLWDDWYCPHCHNWICKDCVEKIKDIKVTYCNICGTCLAHSWELEWLLEENNNG